MPTMGRLVGAVLLGGLAWYVSLLIIPLFREGTALGWFQEVNTFFGFYAGWSIAGSRAGKGYVAAVSYGVTATVAMVVMALFFNSTIVMVQNSLRKAYDGVGEAVVGVFGLMFDHAMLMATPTVLGSLLVGGVLAGLITEFIGGKLP